jgi:carbamoyl-phosphate synthase small subunit
MSPPHRHPHALLALEDGTVFTGSGFGAAGTHSGEVVFNTAMTGYQEILTDPSYCGQLVVMTYPLIGNYGVNREDVEAARPHLRGFVVKELAQFHSNYRASLSLEAYIAEAGIVGIEGIDTRALTRKLRVAGAMRGVLSTQLTDPEEAVHLARDAPSMIGADLVSEVAPREAFDWNEGLDGAFISSRRASTHESGGAKAGDTREGAPGAAGAAGAGRPATGNGLRVVAIDCGMKRNILRHLVDLGASVRVVPPTCRAAEVLDLAPGGVFISNGPGDPAAVHYAVELVRGLIGQVPLFGICLGHQLLGLALGAETYKLKFGHHGANHPVRNTTTGRVEITSQNHGFAVDVPSLESAGGTVTHINLNDHTLEGFVHRDAPLLAVQYHPEASPGPHDATYLFDCFATMLRTGRSPTGEEMADAQRALQERG